MVTGRFLSSICFSAAQRITRGIDKSGVFCFEGLFLCLCSRSLLITELGDNAAWAGRERIDFCLTSDGKKTEQPSGKAPGQITKHLPLYVSLSLSLSLSLYVSLSLFLSLSAC